MQTVASLLRGWILRPEGPDFLAVYAILLLLLTLCPIWMVLRDHRTEARLKRAMDRWVLRQERLRKQKILFHLAMRTAKWQQTQRGDWVKYAVVATWN